MLLLGVTLLFLIFDRNSYRSKLHCVRLEFYDLQVGFIFLPGCKEI